MPWEEVGATFSDIWYRVAESRPRLTPHANIIRQRYGPTIAYIVEDPASGQYYRLSESAYFFVGLLDGRRTVDDAWNACNAQLGDEAPTQRECVQLLSQLQLFGLLLGDNELAADMVLERKLKARETRVKRRTGMWVFWNIPLYNPEPFLDRHRRVVELIFSRWGALVWLVTMSVAAYLLIRSAGRFGDEFAGLLALDPRGMAAMGAVFLVLRAIHEMGHAAACKAMGGRSTEIGVIMIAGVLPLPYCDATTAWRFARTWPRVLVSAAGVIVESLVAAIAGIYWALADPAVSPTLVGIAYQVMIISGVSTLLFNLNPLLRYDGYYILSDLVGSPNLSQRSRDLLRFLIERYLFGLKSSQPPRVRDRTEATVLTVFGLLSTPYRIFIGLSIVLLIMDRYAAFGLLLGGMMAAMWLVWPVLKVIGYLASSPKLLGRRGRACLVTMTVVGIPLVGLGLVPVSSAEYAPAIGEAKHAAPLRAGESGFVRSIAVRAGRHVAKGDPVVTLQSPGLQAEAARLGAQLDRAQRQVDEAMSGPALDFEVALAARQQLQLQYDRVAQRLDALVLRAPISGVVAPSDGTAVDFDNIVGRYLPHGALIGFVSSPELVVRALVPDRSYAHILADAEPSPNVTVRVRGHAGQSVRGTITSRATMGTRDLQNPAYARLTAGSIAVKPSQSGRLVAMETHWLIEIEADESTDNPVSSAQPGVRARVRFGLSREPLAAQLFRRGTQYLDARLHR